MNVVVNGEATSLAGPATVLAFLESRGVDPRRVVVELNRIILQRDKLAETSLRDGDQLEVVHFVGGG